MSKQMRAIRRELKRENRKWPAALTPVPVDQWPDGAPDGLVAVLRSRRFLVQQYAEGGGLIRLTVCRTHVRTDGDYKSGITWEDLQQLKREAGFGDFDAVEIFPRDRDLVDCANMRHLWVFMRPISFIWRATEGKL